jgi:hypothetical protein
MATLRVKAAEAALAEAEYPLRQLEARAAAALAEERLLIDFWVSEGDEMSSKMMGSEDESGQESVPQSSQPPSEPDAIVAGSLVPPVRVGRLVGFTSSDELIRAGLALVFVVIFLITVALAFRNVDATLWTNTKELLQLLLPAEIALLGSAVGFYFGTKK